MQEGSVVCGTLRPQDLIPAFLDAMHDLDPDFELAEPIPQCALDDDDDEYWREAFWCALEELGDALDACAADGYCFGAHPGDPANFGFWALEEN